MIYECNGTLKPVDLNQIDKEHVTVGLVTLAELRKSDYSRIGFFDVWLEECEKSGSRFRSMIEVSDGFLFSLLYVRNISASSSGDRIGLFIKHNLMLVVSVKDADGSTERAFEEAIHRPSLRNVTLERVVCAFFERLVFHDTSVLETYENKIGKLEEQIEKGTTGKAFNGEILALRRKLLVVRHYYEQLLDLIETMIENDPGIFCEENTRLFRIVREKITRLSSNTQLLRDSLVQVREAYMAALDYNANSIMKVFTVVTTIFMPLTLIVGWYGMNFHFMPELTWEYGYLAVIILSVTVVIASILFFKRKKLL
ncbi:MAG TPA: CorA family divalent cation transporter [Candidatus Cryosericum sp.]|nr:CorA family divalent cation transporter [Candidatus Cryosericum sp.]